jgi:hypothetical protein
MKAQRDADMKAEREAAENETCTGVGMRGCIPGARAAASVEMVEKTHDPVKELREGLKNEESTKGPGPTKTTSGAWRGLPFSHPAKSGGWSMPHARKDRSPTWSCSSASRADCAEARSAH